jgi:hypothetical protein
MHDESQQNSQQQTTRPTTNQTHRQDQEGMMTEQGEGQRMNGLGRSQLNATSMNNAINQITPAKRQKMEIESDKDAQSSQNEQTRVGHAQQASPRQ